MRYLLKDGNIIIASADFIAENYPDAVLIDEPLVTVRTTRVVV